MVDPGLLLLAAIGFLAYTARGISGAASAIIFNALFGLALVVGLAGSLTLLDGLYWLALADLLANVVMFVALRRELILEAFVRRLLVFTVPVSIAFTLLLPSVHVEALTLGLGVVLMASGVYLALRHTLRIWSPETLLRRAAPTGAGAGILSGLYGMPGPIFMIYLAHAGPETGRFRIRATVIALVLGTARALTLILSGAIGSETLVEFGLTMPVVFAGLGLGMWLHPMVGPRAFRFGLGAIVMLAGLMLLARTVAA